MHMRKRRRGLQAAVLALAIGVVPFIAPQGAWAATLNVRDFGARGDGSANDTAAINTAIQEASTRGGGGNTLVFPSGTYRSANSIHLKSNVTIHLDAGATIMGAGGSGYDRAESNPNDDFQDFGHSHFHNAMLWGENLSNVAFEGEGTIDGGGNLITGNPDQGKADKIISIRRCNGYRVDGIRLRRGGHFAMLTNGCNNITSNNLLIETADNRDGWNVISAKNVKITNANIA